MSRITSILPPRCHCVYCGRKCATPTVPSRPPVCCGHRDLVALDPYYRDDYEPVLPTVFTGLRTA